MQRAFGPTVLVIIACALCLRVALAIAHPLATDDGSVYALIAHNWLAHGAYSSEPAAPYVPNYFRLPGYPAFLAATYALFGAGADGAVRVLQALADTITCVLAAELAAMWSGERGGGHGKRRAFAIALVFAAMCPFTIIYVSAILTETVTTMVWTAAFVSATHALRARKPHWFLATGVLCGLGALLRPDGVFVPAAIMVTLAWHAWEEAHMSGGATRALRRNAAHTLLLALGVCAALAPWTIRNARAFGEFMPLAPKYPNLRGEFVEIGYRAWLRTWVDDFRYVDPLEWQLGNGPIALDAIPARAFDSASERERVGVLLERYAHAGRAGAVPRVEMTPQIDAAFGELARERVARHPLRCTLGVGLRRALALWFDTHSDYYPFAGPLLPWAEVPEAKTLARVAFMCLIWLYTLLAAAGVARLWRARETRAWAVLLCSFLALRMALLATLENPEPRYTMEFFPLLTGAIALACCQDVATLSRSRRSRVPLRG